MDLNELYNMAEKEHIKIYDWHISDVNGIYLNYNKINAIALNYDELGTYIDEKCTLAEELGHYYTNATYSMSSSPETIARQEYMAKKWSFLTLVPFDELKKAINKGFTEVYQLAEYFEVSDVFMENCLRFYINKYGYVLKR